MTVEMLPIRSKDAPATSRDGCDAGSKCHGPDKDSVYNTSGETDKHGVEFRPTRAVHDEGRELHGKYIRHNSGF